MPDYFLLSNIWLLWIIKLLFNKSFIQRLNPGFMWYLYISRIVPNSVKRVLFIFNLLNKLYSFSHWCIFDWFYGLKGIYENIICTSIFAKNSLSYHYIHYSLSQNVHAYYFYLCSLSSSKISNQKIRINFNNFSYKTYLVIWS